MLSLVDYFPSFIILVYHPKFSETSVFDAGLDVPHIIPPLATSYDAVSELWHVLTGYDVAHLHNFFAQNMATLHGQSGHPTLPSSHLSASSLLWLFFLAQA
jgi:hypothetical protein